MEILKLLLVFSCAVACLTESEVSQGGRQKRQSGLNGAHTDAMDRSRNGGFGGSYNPMITPGGFGGRLGGGYGGTVWSSGKNSIGLGAAARADVGIDLNNRRPFVRAPELGVGATYNRGANSFSFGAGRTFGSRPSNQFGFTYSRRFRRALDNIKEDDEQSVVEDDENQPIIGDNEEQPIVDYYEEQPIEDDNEEQLSIVDTIEEQQFNDKDDNEEQPSIVDTIEEQQFIDKDDNEEQPSIVDTIEKQQFIDEDDNEEQPSIVDAIEEQQLFDENNNETKEDANVMIRNKRQTALNTAMANSLTNKPVGTPQFSYQIDGAGRNLRNFGASGSAGAGMKVWERGHHSIGLGVGASGDLARIDGRTYTGNHQIGAGVGYQNRGFSATLGAGRTLGRFPSNHFGLNLGYRFKRALEEDVVEQEDSGTDNNDYTEDSHNSHRSRRQAINTAMANTLTNKGVGKPQFSYQVDGAGKNFRNFGASGSVGSGVKVWERGPHSVGLGVGASGDLARINGKTYTGNYQVGAGVGYHHKSGFSATMGAGRGVGPFRSKPYGQVEVGYQFG